MDIPRRLRLFIQVCHAIQHAHQKGVIHRDIKPSNILVTMHDGMPMPKVIDFGIAKATEGRLTDNRLVHGVRSVYWHAGVYESRAGQFQRVGCGYAE